MNSKVSLKKLFGFMLAITMLIVPSLVFASENNQIQPRWSFIRDCTHLLERVGSKKALLLSTTMETDPGYYAGIQAQLQKYNFSTGDWDNVSGRYWDMAYEDSFAYIEETNLSVSSGTYRFALCFNAYTTSWFEIESFACYTDQVTIP